MKKLVVKAIEKKGYRLAPTRLEFEQDFLEIYARCREFTMTSIDRMYALWQATRYVARFNIPGDFVECGVWKGGSAMLVCLTLLQLDQPRNVYMYDTFRGMVEPTSRDVGYDVSIGVHGRSAIQRWSEGRKDDHNEWNYVPLEEVRRNLSLTGYPATNLKFVEGRVEETLPSIAPSQIAILRLDTDFYESTLHELRHLYPRLAKSGVLIIDDYGHWLGAKDAVDEYFETVSDPILLNRIDSTGRIATKA